MNDHNTNPPTADFFYNNFLKRIHITTGYYNYKGDIVESRFSQNAVYYFTKPFNVDTRFKRKFKKYYYRAKRSKDNAYYRFDIFRDTEKIYKACVSLNNSKNKKQFN